MPSRWDDLDASGELEQAIHDALKAALSVRGVDVVHHGTAASHAPAGKPDIELCWKDKSLLLLVEVTKRTGSAAEGEFVSTTAHLESAINAGGYKRYGLLFTSPAIGARLRKNFLESNRIRERERRPGRTFMLDFAGLQAILDELVSRDPDLYPSSRWLRLLDRPYWSQATDDVRARQATVDALLEEAAGLREELAEETRREHVRIEQELKSKMTKLEDQLRDRGITGDNANRTLIYLTFMRLYEEKRIAEGHVGVNRMTSDGFNQWVTSQNAQIRATQKNRLTNYLLTVIREEQPDLKAAGLLLTPDGNDVQLHTNVTDDLIEELIFAVLDDYDFIGSRIDILGVVFETLARRAEKDTRIGQFFTPDEVVNFGAEIVELDPRDTVLDPAVGTARFLIAAMVRMLQRKELEGRPVAEVERSIKMERLFGVDIDHWVATIAKMNMYIHGDGKSNVATGNGLVIGDRCVLSQWPSGVDGKIDVLLTNPPLGEVNYLFAAKDWAKADSSKKGQNHTFDFLRSLGVVPYTIKEEAAHSVTAARLERIGNEIDQLEGRPRTPERDKRLAQLRRNKTRQRKVLDNLAALISRGEVTLQPSGKQLKGGALFIGAIAKYLSTSTPHRSGEPYEWRGGRGFIVVDEAILNTPAYSTTRRFIRQNFFVKAVFSLGRPAFKYLAHTDAKTSLLYVIKKPDPKVGQQEPVFYDHAEKVGYSGIGEWIGSDLPESLEGFVKLREVIKGGYIGAKYDRESITISVRSLTGFGTEWHIRDIGEAEDRLDFFHARRMDIEHQLVESSKPLCVLGDLIEPRRLVRPEPSRTGEYEFASIERSTGRIKSRGKEETKYSVNNMWVVNEGDIVVSGIDLVFGSVAVAHAEVDGLVMSNEMFPYTVKKSAKVLPEYVVLMLRTPQARALLEGMVTGTSNRTRVSNADEIFSLVLPRPPSTSKQRVMTDLLNRSHSQRAAAERDLDEASARAAAQWGN